MKKILYAVLLMLSLTGVASACDIRVSGLSSEAIAELKVACEQAKLANLRNKEEVVGTFSEKITTANVEQLSAVGKVSTEIAKAIGLAASELGIAVNVFLQSPAGILVAIGVFWKLFLVQSIGIVLLTMTIGAMIWMYRRVMICSFENKEQSVLWGLVTYTKSVPLYSSVRDMSDDQGGMLFFTTVFGVIVSTLIVWLMIA